MKVPAAAMLIFAVCGSACGRGTSTSRAEKPAATGPVPIDVVRVVQRPIDVTLAMPGELVPYETVAMFPRATGFVKTIRVDRGSHVRAGELMAELEAPELMAQRAEAESKLQAAEAQLGVTRSKADADASTLERLKAAAATPGVVAGNDVVLAQKTVEADQGQITAAQRNVEAAREALKSVTQMEAYLKMRAPFDGVVTERNVHPGALVGPNSGAGTATPIFRVVDRNRLRLGKVARIAQSVDVKTRTMAIEIDVRNADGRLTPGTFCQVSWPVRRPAPSLMVPSGSVANTTGRTFVIRVRNGKAEWIDVKTGLATGSLVEVFGDLQAGDEIAARGTDEIRPGADVRPK
jgi:membrane fusion protein, multidrug efflux system